MATDPWLPIARPEGAVRLFCLPYAGGSAAIFRPWLSELASAIGVYAVQLPGRGARLGEPAFLRLASLVASLEAVLVPHLDRPYALFGHSMGAVVAFELARHLRRTGQPLPVVLFVSSRRAPQLPARETPLHRLPEAQFIERLKRFNGIPDVVLAERELLQLVLPTLRADFEVIETYEPGEEAPLDCALVALGGRADPSVARSDLEAWRIHSTASFTLNMFEGDHFYLHSARQPLLRTLEAHLLP